MTRIVSVWLPAWPIERMRRHMPANVPDDRPFALVEAGTHGITITAANACALALGVRTGAALADARAALPALAVRQAEPRKDRVALAALARWCGRYGPSRNVDGVDGVWVDVTGVAHLFGGEKSLLADLVRRFAAFGITARAGLADTLGAAFALARFATSAATPFAIAGPSEMKSALADLPVSGLRLEPDTTRLLQRLGLKRISQLYGVPRAALERRFHATAKSKGVKGAGLAAAVLLRLDQALGSTSEPRAPLIEPPQFLARLAFPEPLISADGIEHAIEALAHDLAASLTHAGRGARRIVLSLYRVDGTIAEAVIGTSAPCRDPSHICRLLAEKTQSLDAGFGIDVVTLAAPSVEALDAQQRKLAPDGPGAMEDPAALIDRLSNRLGRENVLRLVPRASHIPERAQLGVAALASRSLAAPQARGLARRPPFLLAPPEPITVLAEVPEGAPALMTWRKVERRIVRAEGPERIEPEWWLALGQGKEDAAAPQSRTRDYYCLEDETGAGYWVFREGLYACADETRPRWFVHGLFG
jgi:protein ImuB